MQLLTSMSLLCLGIALASCNASVDREQQDYEASRAGAESRVRDLIKSANVCETDLDCGMVNLGCPFDCGTGLNLTQQAPVVEAANEYQQKYSMCVYRCKMPTSVQCIADECVAK